MGNIWFFEKVDLFDIFCPHKFAEFRGSHQFRSYGKGEFVYLPDDASDQVFLIADGKIRILYYTESGEEVVRNILTKGEVFGELALLGQERRQDYAQAVRDGTTLCPLSLEQMVQLMKDDKPFALKVNKLIGLRIQRLERRLDALVFKDARTRVIELIRELATERGVHEGDRYRVEHSLTHKDIADLTGTSRQTVTTLLNELRHEGMISIDRKIIYIPDLKILA